MRRPIMNLQDVVEIMNLLGVSNEAAERALDSLKYSDATLAMEPTPAVRSIIGALSDLRVACGGQPVAQLTVHDLWYEVEGAGTGMVDGMYHYCGEQATKSNGSCPKFECTKSVTLEEAVEPEDGEVGPLSFRRVTRQRTFTIVRCNLTWGGDAWCVYALDALRKLTHNSH
jgi:hypothetical protein